MGEDDSADSESDTEARDDDDELQKPDVKLPTQKEIPSTPTKPKPITHNLTPMPTKTTTHPHDEDEDEDVDDLSNMVGYKERFNCHNYQNSMLLHVSMLLMSIFQVLITKL